MKAYSVKVKLSKQEDGLWRAEVPALPGCFVDSKTLSGALNDLQEVAAMFIDLYEEEGRSLPDTDDPVDGVFQLPIIPGEHKIKRPSRPRVRTTPQ